MEELHQELQELNAHIVVKDPEEVVGMAVSLAFVFIVDLLLITDKIVLKKYHITTTFFCMFFLFK